MLGQVPGTCLPSIGRRGWGWGRVGRGLDRGGNRGERGLSGMAVAWSVGG